MIREYYRRIGVDVVSIMTGDGRVDDIRRCHGAALNVVQCSGAMTFLAEMMKEKFGIPYIRVSYFGMDDMARALYDVADRFPDAPEIKTRALELVRKEIDTIFPQLQEYRKDLEGKRAAIYVGGAFKAFSLIKALDVLGMRVVLAGSQTGNEDDYKTLKEMCEEGTVILDDANPLELSKYIIEKKGRPVHRRSQGKAHRLQAGDRVLRPQSRTQNPPGRFFRHAPFRQGTARFGHQPGLAVRPLSPGRIYRRENRWNPDTTSKTFALGPRPRPPRTPASSARPWARPWSTKGSPAPSPCSTAPRDAPPTSGAT